MSDGFVSAITPPRTPITQTLASHSRLNKEWNERMVYAITMAESSGNPKAYNPEWHFDRKGNKICQGSFGKWQLACLHGKIEDLYDPVKSTAIAYKLWKTSGFYPWTTFTSGKYLKYY